MTDLTLFEQLKAVAKAHAPFGGRLYYFQASGSKPTYEGEATTGIEFHRSDAVKMRAFKPGDTIGEYSIMLRFTSSNMTVAEVEPFMVEAEAVVVEKMLQGAGSDPDLRLWHRGWVVAPINDSTVDFHISTAVAAIRLPSKEAA